MSEQNKTSRREWLIRAAKTAAAYPIFNMGITAMSCGGGKGGSSSSTASSGSSSTGSYTGTDDQLMDDIQRAAFDFFWTEASPTTGQIRDRAPAVGGGTSTFASVASTGYGLGALCIGDKRGYGDAAQIKARVTTTLDFLANKMPNEHGFYYHFVDINTGARFNNQIELSDIDSAILFCGVMFARQYYSSDSQIQSLATTILNRADWAWFLNGGTMYSMQWTPEAGFSPDRWDHYCELMMMYLFGLGSPTHPIPAASWTAWSRPPISYQGYNFIYGDSPLFVHQFSHAWFDFRNKTDSLGINYFQNSIDATKAHKLFCQSLKSQFSDYADNLWGITASDYAKGYTAWGGPPAKGPIDGTVVPCACAGSLPFDFTDCIAVLRNIRNTYPKAWQRYGFVDAFNPLTGWYDTDVIGIDQGISMLMAENQRSGLVWQVFNTAPEVQAGMKAAGFK
jgi:hypothetical protein